MKAATPTKLRSGWGAKVQSEDVAVGQVVTITTKAGKSWQARVTKVVWSGDGTSLCETASLDRSASRSRNYDPERFNGYGAPRGGYRRACKTDGNCSSFGSGRSCGGHDCDGF
jgi:hypothetical protein